MIERQGQLQRILVDTPATLSVTFYADGDVVDPGTVAVVATRLDGTTISGNASGTGAAARTYALTAAQTADLDTLSVAWTSTTYGTVTTRAEIVGNRLFTLAEARAFDNGKLSNTSTYSNATIEEARSRIEDDFEEITGVSFIPRAARTVFSGNGTVTLLNLPLDTTAVRSVETRSGATWTAFDSDDLDDVLVESWGGLVRDVRGIWPSGSRNVRVLYEYGYEQVPLEIKRAGLALLRDSAVSSNIDPRAMSYSDGIGTIRFVTPGYSRGAWYSNPEVNAALQRYARNVPVVG